MYRGGDGSQASRETEVRILERVEAITGRNPQFTVIGVDTRGKPHSASFGFDTRTRTPMGNPVTYEEEVARQEEQATAEKSSLVNSSRLFPKKSLGAENSMLNPPLIPPLAL